MSRMPSRNSGCRRSAAQEEHQPGVAAKRAPGAIAKPRRKSAAARRLPPGALQLGAGAARPRRWPRRCRRGRPRSRCRGSPCRRRRSTCPRHSFSVSPAKRAARAGKRIEGAQAPLDDRGGLRPVDRGLGLVDLVGVGHALGRLRRAAAGRRRPRVPAPRRSAVRPSAASRSCRLPVVSSARDGQRARPAACRRCPGRRPSA